MSDQKPQPPAGQQPATPSRSAVAQGNPMSSVPSVLLSPQMPSAVAAQIQQSPMRPQMPAASPARTRRPDAASRKSCNCKNSKCLKLYCECFASGRFCDLCNCVNCANNELHRRERSLAIQAILERNPTAFYPKIADGGESKHAKGCNCKKSGCLKKYCECFQAGIYCADSCKCIDCKNFEGSSLRGNVLNALEAPLDAKKWSTSNTPQKRPRPDAKAMAPASGVPPTPSPAKFQATSAGNDTPVRTPAPPTARPARVLQGLLCSDVLNALCCVLLQAVDDVSKKASFAAPPTTQPPSSAPREMPTGGRSLGASRESEPTATQATPLTASSKLSPLAEAQEACVLQEFLQTLQKVVAVSQKKQQQFQSSSAAEQPAGGEQRQEGAARSAEALPGFPAMPSTYQHSMRAVTAAVAHSAAALDKASLYPAATEAVALPMPALHLPGLSAPAPAPAADVPQQFTPTAKAPGPESALHGKEAKTPSAVPPTKGAPLGVDGHLRRGSGSAIASSTAPGLQPGRTSS